MSMCRSLTLNLGKICTSHLPLLYQCPSGISPHILDSAADPHILHSSRSSNRTIGTSHRTTRSDHRYIGSKSHHHSNNSNNSRDFSSRQNTTKGITNSIARSTLCIGILRYIIYTGQWMCRMVCKGRSWGRHSNPQSILCT